MFRRESDEEVRYKTLTVPFVPKVSIVRGGSSRDKGTEQSEGFGISY